MSALQVFVDGVGLYAPGLNGWAQACGVLAAPQTYAPAPLQLPAIESLPAAERRRLGLAVKLAMASGFDAARHLPATALEQLATVFASSAGDSDNCNQLLEALTAPEPSISPTRFHNAVHNAASGYWSIATGSRQPSTSLSAYDGGFAAALLEAASQVVSSGQAYLLVVFDTPYPQPLQALRPIGCACGVALLLTPQRSQASLASLTMALTPDAFQTLPTPALETMRQQVPAARALPLLTALARQTPQAMVIEYLAGLNLAIDFQP
jgi:hypothetical protein